MSYAISISLLVVVIAGFFAWGRRGYRRFGIAQMVLRVLVALPLLLSGVVLHFFRAKATASIIPPFFPAHLFLAIFTGVCEVAGAVGLFVPRWRRAAAFWIAVMMVAVFPSNIYAAGQVIDGLRMPSVPVRLAMQVGYVVLVLLAGFGLPTGREKRSKSTISQ